MPKNFLCEDTAPLHFCTRRIILRSIGAGEFFFCHTEIRRNLLYSSTPLLRRQKNLRVAPNTSPKCPKSLCHCGFRMVRCSCNTPPDTSPNISPSGCQVLGDGCWWVVGGVSGGVCGEVTKKHLTIRKADKQGDLVQFGEVLAFFRRNIFCGCCAFRRVSRQWCRRCSLSWSETISDVVNRHPWAGQRLSLSRSADSYL